MSKNDEFYGFALYAFAARRYYGFLRSYSQNLLVVLDLVMDENTATKAMMNTLTEVYPSSETQGQLVGSIKCAW